MILRYRLGFFSSTIPLYRLILARHFDSFINDSAGLGNSIDSTNGALFKMDVAQVFYIYTEKFTVSVHFS